MGDILHVYTTHRRVYTLCPPHAEDVLAHPLLRGGEAVPAEADRAYPSAEVLALVHDRAR
ncbi:hypothetical protein GCM10010421_10070 [Streptomyces glaucus]|uniref:Uncharacterized protein n=1 Tax=Streptomyces glaucus TaxID=284029 RepID=A0ABN3J9M5_9ACTN